MKTEKHFGRLRHNVSHAAVYLQAFVFVIPVALGGLPKVSALDLTSRTVRISSARAGAPTQHTFSFNLHSSSAVGSITFEYCSNSPLYGSACTVPTGLNISSANLTSQSGTTGFSLDGPASTVNKLVLSRTAAAGNIGPAQYTFTNIINPTTNGETTYVRMATFTSSDGTGAPNDTGSVAFAINSPFEVQAYVPPFLTFCVGVYVTLNCNNATGSKIDVGELRTNVPATGSLQFSGATNDSTGYTTYLTGATMTSGNNIINALASNAGSNPGTSQFGFNLRSNTDPVMGLDPAGPGDSAPVNGYGIPNSYRFVNGEAVTSSSLPTDFKIFTASYIVNVSGGQPPGVYATTMTFTAIASF